MEQLLHYVWKHKLFPLTPLRTTDGRDVEVVDTGLHNKNAGPDFFNAKIRLGDTMWVGNVEIHDKASDWYAHGHDGDVAYDNVVLHVVGKDDVQACTSQGHSLAQLVLPVPTHVVRHYEELLHADRYPPCYQIIPDLSQLMIHSWMSALQTERLEQKTKMIMQRVERCGGSWEDAFFMTLARNYGFGINGDAFETWAAHMPLQYVAHHRDDLFQIEAFFIGQAGLLDISSIPARYRQQTTQEDYFDRLRQEYLYLAHKFSLQPMNFHEWRFLRLRPQNFPHVRLSQLARLYCERRASLSQIVECNNISQVFDALSTSATPYWQTHYTFGLESKKSEKKMSKSSLCLLTINTVVPLLFAYGRMQNKESLCDRAFEFLEQLPAEQNHLVRMWHECGIPVQSAGDSQALIQLRKVYCDRKDCLRCRIGYEYMKKK